MIETARLILSPLEPSDSPGLSAAANHVDVARMMETIALPFTEADARARIEARQCDANRFTFAMREKPTGVIIGEIAAGSFEAGATPRLGYFVRPASWGRGFAGEALTAALLYAFRTLGWDIMEADAFDDNPASTHLLQKAGFVPIGASECRSAARAEEDATTLFRLTRDEWLEKHRPNPT